MPTIKNYYNCTISVTPINQIAAREVDFVIRGYTQ